jgi:signal transduction histidine kinase
MIRLVNDLLDVSHIESGQKFNIEKKSGNIIALINNVIKDQKLNTPNKKLKITLDNKCPKELIFDFDADKIYQVFSNLISNSVKYSGQEAKIIIGTTCPGNEAQFFVKDFGLGIPNNQKDRVFQKFFRADNISTISTEGTGLGLYIVKGIIEAHGGKVWFDSKQNEGTTFYFTLPLKS